MDCELKITFRDVAPSEGLCALVRQRIEQVALAEPFKRCSVCLERWYTDAGRAEVRAHIELHGSPNGTRILVQASDHEAAFAIYEAIDRITRKPSGRVRSEPHRARRMHLALTS